jgi:chromosome segregation ATPase
MNSNPASKKDLEIAKNELNTAIGEVKADLDKVKDDLNEVKVDLDKVKVDLNEVKVDLNEVKVDLNEVKGEIKNVKGDIEHLTIQVAQNQAELSEFKEENRQKQDAILTAIDGLAKLITNGQVEKVATESALRRHENRLEDHEARIGVLEKKTA